MIRQVVCSLLASAPVDGGNGRNGTEAKGNDVGDSHHRDRKTGSLHEALEALAARQARRHEVQLVQALKRNGGSRRQCLIMHHFTQDVLRRFHGAAVAGRLCGCQRLNFSSARCWDGVGPNRDGDTR